MLQDAIKDAIKFLMLPQPGRHYAPGIAETLFYVLFLVRDLKNPQDTI